MDVDYRSHEGVHDWPYWREDMAEAKEIGLFREVPSRSAALDYSTVAQRGAMWGFRYQLRGAAGGARHLRAPRHTAVGQGSGKVVLRRRGCMRDARRSRSSVRAQASAMPGATFTSTSRGPSAATASPSAACSSSRPSTRCASTP